MNGYRQEGVGVMDMTIHNGERWSASKAYLWPALKERENLQVETGAMVLRVLFDKNKAIGLEYTKRNRGMHYWTNDPFGGIQRNERKKVYCEGDVILSGGAINSPQLLMLSGVGPGDILKNYDVPIVADLPGVGRNLQDHLEVYVQARSSKPITLYDRSSWKFPHNMIRIGLQWFINKTGEAASSHLETGGFVRSSDKVDHPDIQFHFLAGTVEDHGRKAMTEHAFQVHVGTMRAKSRGWLRIKDNHPFLEPFIQPNYFEDEQDLKDFVPCIEAARKIFEQPAFDEYRSEELYPGSDVTSDQAIMDFVKKRADSAYHPSCTCKMGKSTDNMAVIDPQTLNVYGTENLKVVDASIMPSIVSGNLNGPVIMIAEKAADIIKGKAPLPPSDAPVWKPSP